MMRIPPVRTARKQESTIALINVVFLMLIFFLIAGSLAPPADPQLTYVASIRDEAAPPPDMLFVRADGTATWRGAPVDLKSGVEEWKALLGGETEEQHPFRIAADRDLPASTLLDIIADIRGAGVENIVLVTERNTQ